MKKRYKILTVPGVTEAGICFHAEFGYGWLNISWGFRDQLFTPGVDLDRASVWDLLEAAELCLDELNLGSPKFGLAL